MIDNLPVNDGLGLTQFIQFRMVQLEHGGGKCNCWGFSNFTNPSIDFTSVPPCLVKQSVLLEETNCSDVSEGIFFCGGSASVPRGFVSDLYLIGGTSTLSCNEIPSRSSLTNVIGNNEFTEDCPSDDFYPQL